MNEAELPELLSRKSFCASASEISINLHNSIFTIFSNGKIYTATVIKIDDGFFSINEYTNYLVVVVPIPIFWVINYAIGS